MYSIVFAPWHSTTNSSRYTSDSSSLECPNSLISAWQIDDDFSPAIDSSSMNSPLRSCPALASTQNASKSKTFHHKKVSLPVTAATKRCSLAEPTGCYTINQTVKPKKCDPIESSFLSLSSTIQNAFANRQRDKVEKKNPRLVIKHLLICLLQN